MTTRIGIIPTGSVEYSAEDASDDINAIIDCLQQARDEGITHVCLESGNYRGAKYMTIYADEIEPVGGW